MNKSLIQDILCVKCQEKLIAHLKTVLKTEKQQMVSVEHAARSTDQPKNSTRIEKNITDNLGIVEYLSQE